MFNYNSLFLYLFITEHTPQHYDSIPIKDCGIYNSSTYLYWLHAINTMTWLYWTIAILFGLLLAVLTYRKDKNKDIPVKWLPAALRFLTGSLTALLLLAPAFPGMSHREERPHIIWLQDVSSSTQQSLGQYAATFRSKEKKVLEKLSQKYTVTTYGFGSKLIKDSIYTYTEKATDIAGALSDIANQNQDKNIGAIVVASDGIFNQGANPVFIQLPNPIPVYTVALGDSTTPIDTRIEAIHTNKTATLNSTIEIFSDIVITGLAGTQATVTLSQNNKTIATQTINVSGNSYTGSISFNTTAQPAGPQRYTISIAPANGERNLRNNSISAIVEVTEKKGRILLLAAAPHPDIATIHSALKTSGQYTVDLSVNGSIPGELNQYQAAIAYQYYPASGLGDLPVWYILGTQSNADILKKVGSLTGNLNPAPRALNPVLNAGFNLYTLPATARQSIPKMPPLNGIGLNLKPGNSSILNDAGGNRLWSYHQGSPSYSILNGDGLWRWNIYEYKNFRNQQTTTELIRQTINFLQAAKDDKPFRIVLPKNNLTDNEALIVLAELRNPNGTLNNTPEATLTLKNLSNSLTYNFEKAGNSYRADAGLLAAGTYNLSAKVSLNGKTYEDYALCYISDIPLEALRTQADYALMHQLAQQHQGGFFTQYTIEALADSLMANQNIQTKIHSRIEDKPLVSYKWLFFLIIALAGTEWFLRKFWGMTA